MKTTKTVNKVTTNKVTNNNDYEVKNKVFSKATLKALCQKDISFDLQTIDNLLENAHNKPLLNTMTKEKKVEYTVFYLLLLYKDSIISHKKEMLRRFKYDNAMLYNKDTDRYNNTDVQLEYLLLKKDITDTNNGIKELLDMTIEKSKVNTLYRHYAIYQYSKNSDEKSLYRDIYIVHIAKWLHDLNIKPSMQTLEYLCDDVSTVRNKKVRVNKKDNSTLNTKIAMKSDDFATDFIYTLVQAMLDNKVINVASYVSNKEFMLSLRGLEVQNSVEFLQNAMQDIELTEV